MEQLRQCLHQHGRWSYNSYRTSAGKAEAEWRRRGHGGHPKTPSFGRNSFPIGILSQRKTTSYRTKNKLLIRAKLVWLMGKQNKVQATNVQTRSFKRASFWSWKQFSFGLDQLGEKCKQKKWNSWETKYFIGAEISQLRKKFGKRENKADAKIKYIDVLCMDLCIRRYEEERSQQQQLIWQLI